MGEPGAGGGQVLAVVEHQQDLAAVQGVGQVGRRRGVRGHRRQAESLDDGVGQDVGAADLGEFHPAGAVAQQQSGGAGRALGEAGLADAPDAGEGEQPVLGEQPAHLLDLVVAADEAGGRVGHAARRVRNPLGGGARAVLVRRVRAPCGGRRGAREREGGGGGPAGRRPGRRAGGRLRLGRQSRRLPPAPVPLAGAGDPAGLQVGGDHGPGGQPVPGGGGGEAGRRVGPVSYTHLDVYKRQVRHVAGAPPEHAEVGRELGGLPLPGLDRLLPASHVLCAPRPLGDVRFDLTLSSNCPVTPGHAWST